MDRGEGLDHGGGRRLRGEEWVRLAHDAAGVAGIHKTTRFAYDAVGNRVGVSPNEGEDATRASFDPADQLTALLRKDGSVLESFTYDQNGNLTERRQEDERTTFAYDAADRLVGVSRTEERERSSTAFAYDGDGNLRRETRTGEEQDDPARTLRYTLDLAGPLSQVLTASDGKDEALFLYGLQRIAAFGKDARFYASDVRGSVRATTDERGKVRSVANFDAWGVPKDESEGNAKLASLFGFTGERQDATSGLVYLRARWYAPELARFVSKDTFRGLRRAPVTTHPYEYARNDPTSLTDRSGHSAGPLFDSGAGYSYDGTTPYNDPNPPLPPTPLSGPRPSPAAPVSPSPVAAPVPSAPPALQEPGAPAFDIGRVVEPFVGPTLDIGSRLVSSAIHPRYELTGLTQQIAVDIDAVSQRGRLVALRATRSLTTTLEFGLANAPQVALRSFLQSRVGGAAIGGVSQAIGDFLFHPELTPQQRAGRIVLASAVAVGAAIATPALLAAAGVATTGVVAVAATVGVSALAGAALQAFVFSKIGLGN